MTSSLFQEALADAKQLKEVAEQNAKNAIIDAVTPKIRKFIEDQLLEGATRKADAELEEALSDEDIDLTKDGNDPVDAAGTPEDLAERVSLMRAMSKIVENLSPEESASLIPVVEKMRSTVSKSGSAGIPRAVPSDVRSTHIVKENAAMQSKNKMYEVDLDELMSDEIAHEDEGMHMGHDNEGMHMGDEGVAEDELADLYESLSSLLEADDEEGDAPIEPEGDEEEMEAGDDEGDAGGQVETDEVPESEDMGAIKAELDDLKGMLQQILDSMQGGGGMGAPEMPEEAPEGVPGMPPGASPGPAPTPSETVYRVDESSLMRELRRLREGVTGFDSPAKKVKGALPEAAAEDEGEDHLDEDMGDLEGENAHEGKVKGGKMPAHTKGHGPGKAAPYTEAAKTKIMKENRDLKDSLVKHAEAIDSLRGQLTEMNLFNAKLLYVNRLLQDRELSDAQRRNIIESLDRARSLREVKLLFKGLTESLSRKQSVKSRPELVSESVGSRSVSPTSRPLSTSGVRLNEAVEVHRWAVLAGIGSKS